MANNWNVTTDDYDLYNPNQGDASLPGSPIMTRSGQIEIDPNFFPMPAPLNPSTMDYDENNTGPTTDFWTDYPIRIDINGDIWYRNQNTGINVRGPAGNSNISFDELTPEQKASLKGADGASGVNGTNGRDGEDGADGLSAYEVWLQDNGWLDHPEEHPLSEFYAFIANYTNNLVIEGIGTGSLILNYRGTHNQANGEGSLAAGDNTIAGGDFTFTAGQGTRAAYDYQVAIGSYNVNKPRNLFEIGKGDANLRSNAFEVDDVGNAVAANNVIDGVGNVLANKVDKEIGKGLSANDFTNAYKSFIDNYTVDTEINSQSTNPVTNAAIATALESISIGSGKPEQSEAESDSLIPFAFLTSPTEGTVNELYYSANFTYNPVRDSIKTDINTQLGSYQNVVALGRGLLAAHGNQAIFGTYNAAAATDRFIVGGGVNAQSRTNLLTLNASGDLVVAGEVTDGNGESISDKQDILILDNAPTYNSTNFVNSGKMYDYLISQGMDPTNGFVKHYTITAMQGQITTLQNAVTALQTQITNLIATLHELTDDTYPNNVYTYGIDNDQFYIKLKETEEPEEEEEEEE